MTEEEIKKFAKEYVQNNTDESVNSFIGEQLQKAFIEGTDFMYYSNNEELKKELTEKDKQIAELKKIEEEYYDFIQKKNEEDWKGDNVVGCLKLKIKKITQHLEPQEMTALFEQVEEEVEQEQRIKKLEAYNEKLLNGDIEKHNKIVELKARLNKAKEHTENLLYYVKQCSCERSNYAEIEKDVAEAEQFLKECE